MNPNSPANITSKMNALRIVKIREIVPFPIPWNRFPATIPKGINNKKKTRILIASATLWDNIALSAEYEKIKDNGSANTKKHAQIIMDDINPSLTP